MMSSCWVSETLPSVQLCEGVKPSGTETKVTTFSFYVAHRKLHSPQPSPCTRLLCLNIVDVCQREEEMRFLCENVCLWLATATISPLLRFDKCVQYIDVSLTRDECTRRQFDSWRLHAIYWRQFDEWRKHAIYWRQVWHVTNPCSMFALIWRVTNPSFILACFWHFTKVCFMFFVVLT